jgi:hypothetical protein
MVTVGSIVRSQERHGMLGREGSGGGERRERSVRRDITGSRETHWLVPERQVVLFPADVRCRPGIAHAVNRDET